MTSLAACATLPSSGPTGQQIIKTAGSENQPPLFRIVELDKAEALPVEAAPRSPNLSEATVPPTDLIGPGDVLDISIYEAGVGLFGGANLRSNANGSQVSFDPSAQATRLPVVRVDDGGNIRLPFVGILSATGRTSAELQDMIGSALRGMSQNPQVMVSIAQSITNSVIIAGEAARPGRLVLSTNHETLSDVIALAGGYRGEAKDVVARVERGEQVYEVRLSDLLPKPERDLSIYPGDRITLISAPLSFSVMGAPNRVELMKFPRASLTLAEAVAQAGGANPNMGDPAAIFVFRFQQRDDGTEEPVVYHLNMMRAGAYFLSQRFAMRDKDLIYIGNARANQPTKLVQIIGQLFAPIVTVTTAVRAGN